MISIRDLQTAYKRYILGSVDTNKCMLWSEGTIKVKFRGLFNKLLFEEGLERSSVLPDLHKENKSLFFIDAAVHRLYAYRNLKWLKSNDAVLSVLSQIAESNRFP